MRWRTAWAWIKHPTRGPWLLGPWRRNLGPLTVYPCVRCGDRVAEPRGDWPLTDYCLPHAEMLRAQRLPAPLAPRAVIDVPPAAFTDGKVSVTPCRVEWTPAPAQESPDQ